MHENCKFSNKLYFSKTLKFKMTGNRDKTARICRILYEIVQFLDNLDFHSTDDSWGALDFFDKSQIFCRGKISEIPQSTSCFYQNTESRKWHNNQYKCHKCVTLLWELQFSGKLEFAESIGCLKSCRFFWQVSDCLSRKNIWDPAEHQLSEPKHWKSTTR